MKKKKLLVVYHSMIMGGSTTSLLGLLNNIDSDKYDIDLQLFQNNGPMISELSSFVKVLPEAQKYSGKVGRIIKAIKYLVSGYYFKALAKKRRSGTANSVVMEFQSKYLSKENKKHYDYAISFLEGWSSSFLAYKVNADKKYAWNHSTFSKTRDSQDADLTWLNHVDRIVFVTDACRDDFINALPSMSEKAITIENITDSSIIRKRSDLVDSEDQAYKSFVSSNACKIITVCRITISTKGLDRIVGCASKLKKAGQKFVWCIIGDGADLPVLKEMVKKEGLDDCISLIGKRMNPYPFIKAADFMCMPSRYEGKPMVITESMILGTPPVVTEYLSAHEQIKNGVEGIVINNDDYSLYETVYDFINDSEKIKSMHEYLLAHEYSNKDYIKYIEEVLFD